MKNNSDKLGLLLVLDIVGIAIATFGTALVMSFFGITVDSNLMIISAFFLGVKVLMVGIGDITGMTRAFWAVAICLLLSEGIVVGINYMMAFGVSNMLLMVTAAVDLLVVILIHIIWGKSGGKRSVEVKETQDWLGNKDGEIDSNDDLDNMFYNIKQDTQEMDFFETLDAIEKEDAIAIGQNPNQMGNYDGYTQNQNGVAPMGYKEDAFHAQPQTYSESDIFEPHAQNNYYEDMSQNEVLMDNGNVGLGQTQAFEPLGEFDQTQAFEPLGETENRWDDLNSNEIHSFDTQTPSLSDTTAFQPVVFEDEPEEEPVEAPVEEKPYNPWRQVAYDEPVIPVASGTADLEELEQRLSVLMNEVGTSSRDTTNLTIAVDGFKDKLSHIEDEVDGREIVFTGTIIREKLKTIIDKQYLVDEVLEDLMRLSQQVNSRIDELDRLESKTSTVETMQPVDREPISTSKKPLEFEDVEVEILPDEVMFELAGGTEIIVDGNDLELLQQYMEDHPGEIDFSE